MGFQWTSNHPMVHPVVNGGSTSEPGSYPYSESKMGSQRATSGVSQQHDSDIVI